MFPTISLGGVADAGNTVQKKTDYGLIVEDETRETDHMIRRYGVYWILLNLDEDMDQQWDPYTLAAAPPNAAALHYAASPRPVRGRICCQRFPCLAKGSCSAWKTATAAFPTDTPRKPLVATHAVQVGGHGPGNLR